MSAALDTFLGMLAAGKDGALLRFSLGNEYLKAASPQQAAVQFRCAVTLDPNYSAAWKLLGRALADSGEREQARAAYAEGIRVAESRGDQQAAREMRVFARKLEDKP